MIDINWFFNCTICTKCDCIKYRVINPDELSRKGTLSEGIKIKQYSVLRHVPNTMLRETENESLTECIFQENKSYPKW